MENGPSINGLPNKNGDFHGYVSHNHMVPFFEHGTCNVQRFCLGTRHCTMATTAGILGELQAGVCNVRFYADGSLGRFATQPVIQPQFQWRLVAPVARLNYLCPD